MSKDLKLALRLATKKIRTLGDKAINQNLSYFCGDFAEAYRCGVEEAQIEIMDRIHDELTKREAAKSKS